MPWPGMRTASCASLIASSRLDVVSLLWGRPLWPFGTRAASALPASEPGAALPWAAMPTPAVAAVLTLGCKLNLADSDAIARGLRARGFAVVDGLCEADAYVVNTCSVTHVADRKARRLVRAVRRMAPSAPLAVAGCYPRTAARGVIEGLGADLVVATGEAARGELLAFFGERPGTCATAAPAPLESHGLHTRGFVKAQEGCNDVCAFCIVPRTRGRERSIAAGTVAAEIRTLVDAGVREVVVTGTQLGAWGRDLEPVRRPHELIETILAETEVPRIRFSSLQPQDITPELLGLWGDPRLMPHFHLALQSGSDRVLTAMRRRYDAREFERAVERIRSAAPEAAVTTDIIAGFPGESDDDFEETLALSLRVEFARIHAFPYSARTHTAAARMDGRIDPHTLRQRMERLLDLGTELSHRFQARFTGTTRPVLWEGKRQPGDECGAWWHGHTDNYIPVYAEGGAGRDLKNRITAALLRGRLGDGLAVEIPGGLP